MRNLYIHPSIHSYCLQTSHFHIAKQSHHCKVLRRKTFHAPDSGQRAVYSQLSAVNQSLRPHNNHRPCHSSQFPFPQHAHTYLVQYSSIMSSLKSRKQLSLCRDEDTNALLPDIARHAVTVVISSINSTFFLNFIHTLVVCIEDPMIGVRLCE